MNKEYSADLQKLFLEIMVADGHSYVRVQNIFNPENFDRSLRECAKFIASYSETYISLPGLDQIRAVTNVDLKPVPERND